jgi:hypothetical protein
VPVAVAEAVVPELVEVVEVVLEVQVTEATASNIHTEQSKQPVSLHMTVPTVTPMLK